jgi:phospholipase/carboxylesterase
MTIRFPLSLFKAAFRATGRRGELNAVLPPQGKAPTELVLFLHGVDSRGDAWTWLAEIWRQWLPNAVFVFPDAHCRSHNQPDQFRWWELESFEPRKLDAGVRSALPRLTDQVSQLQAIFGIGTTSTFVAGFSQGAMLALALATRMHPQLGGVLAFGGMAAGLPTGPRKVKNRPPIFLYHGTTDPIIPFAEHALSRAKLKGLGLRVEEFPAAGVAHTIDHAGAMAAGAMMQSWIRRGLG